MTTGSLFDRRGAWRRELHVGAVYHLYLLPEGRVYIPGQRVVLRAACGTKGTAGFWDMLLDALRTNPPPPTDGHLTCAPCLAVYRKILADIETWGEGLGEPAA